ncbi:MAG: hypothetical protein K0S61_1642 [Anaerocolumna sp.]|nr:hypothetical protein [Anaerocolumna sp.]
MKPSGIGGQAVFEGVVMKSKDQYAIAVRKPDNEIVVEVKDYISIAEKVKLFKLPIFRGIITFVESLGLGSKTFKFSSKIIEEEEEKKESNGGKGESIFMGIALILSIIFAVGIFIVLPTFVAGLLSEKLESTTLTAVIEGLIRILLFVIYVFGISQLKDIKRIFMYHGAEHKTINCLEQGFELTVENVKWQSKEHVRCGTGFMVIVMFLSIILFMFIRVDTQWLRYAYRILLIPVVAGVTYEFIRFAARSNSKVVGIINKPGMWLQGITTKEPDDAMIEVAIKSIEAVFDWKDFLGIDDSIQNDCPMKENSTKQTRKSTTSKLNQRNESSKSSKAGTYAHNKNKSKKSVNNTSANELNKVKPVGNAKKSLLMEEDDEILRALEDIVASKEESLDKE